MKGAEQTNRASRPKHARASSREGVAADMVAIAGGSFWMGSDRHYPEEGPSRHVRVDSFLIDAVPVTNAQFAAFAAETGYRTTAERPPDPNLYPGADPDLLKAGSALFVPTSGPVPMNPALWWCYSPGTDWRHPWGPHSGIAGLEEHPVVHVSHADAEAYAAWAGKRLPTEAEWEFAARGGLERKPFAWGDELHPGGLIVANTWIGTFPFASARPGGGFRTTPVRTFPANGYGLYDMIGNVWEWTADWWQDRSGSAERGGDCCIAAKPRGGSEQDSKDPRDPGGHFGRKVLKGGSHLCAPRYCQRYRPAARYPQTIDTSTSHIGFRCAADADR